MRAMERSSHTFDRNIHSLYLHYGGGGGGGSGGGGGGSVEAFSFLLVRFFLLVTAALLGRQRRESDSPTGAERDGTIDAARPHAGRRMQTSCRTIKWC